MIERSIFRELVNHLSKPQATVITGMRRVGKSTALKYLLNKVGHDNKIYLDLERAEHRFTLGLSNYKDIEINLSIEGIDFGKPAVIALDEIQLAAKSVSVIKYLYDTYGVKFLLSGSSSFYLKDRFSESLAGRKRIFEMFPLDFGEFVTFKGHDATALRQFSNQSFQPAFYLKWKALYEDYLRFGGFPEVALAETDDDRRAFLKDIVNAYIQLDILLLSDLSASDQLLRLVRLLAAHVGSRLDFSKLASILSLNRNKIKDYLNLLEYTYFLLPVSAFSKNPARELSKQQKYYLADTGILQELAQVSSGQVFENAVALQLARRGKLQYYQKVSGQEIDFVLAEKTAVEAKETPTQKDLSVLYARANMLSISDRMLVGRHQPASDFKEFVWGGSLVD